MASCWLPWVAPGRNQPGFQQHFPRHRVWHFLAELWHSARQPQCSGCGWQVTRRQDRCHCDLQALGSQHPVVWSLEFTQNFSFPPSCENNTLWQSLNDSLLMPHFINLLYGFVHLKPSFDVALGQQWFCAVFLAFRTQNAFVCVPCIFLFCFLISKHLWISRWDHFLLTLSSCTAVSCCSQSSFYSWAKGKSSG